MNRNVYKNDFNRENYDRVGLMLPKGKAEEWKAQAKAENLSLNAFVQKAVAHYTEIAQGKSTVQNEVKR